MLLCLILQVAINIQNQFRFGLLLPKHTNQSKSFCIGKPLKATPSSKVALELEPSLTVLNL